ncbi:4-methylaminobutanoate oxidase (formaldehyde-forming) [Halomonadaceae bacterium LMG 33818]|uniref:NAD(P)/FAD-dependent oxidoreductase n=1 Tax=Cernens ardua TaxID=3402176 RepID=UPI003EDC97B6
MAPQTRPVTTSDVIPRSTTVVIIGGGIVGLTAALNLAERNIPVLVIEKGRIAAEQSSRNLGWVRKTNRLPEDIPLSLAADTLWSQMAERTGHDVGYRQAGIVFVARNEQETQQQQTWLNNVESLGLDATLLSSREVAEHIPGSHEPWASGLYTPSDGYAEPTLAASAIADAAQKKGAVIVEHCAVRTLSTQGGKVSGVITEHGEILCEQVLLTGGLWSRRFLGNLGISLPTLPLVCSVCRTNALDGPTLSAVGASDFSFRKHRDGGYIVTQRGKLDAPLTLDHLILGRKYLDALKTQRDYLNISLGAFTWEDLLRARHWTKDHITPFEKVRTMDPSPNEQLNRQAMTNLTHAWPQFSSAWIKESWAGVIDVTPDSNPVIDTIDQMSGLTIATGFSGHGFGTSPAAGQLAADLVSGMPPLVDPSPYKFSRF